MENNRAIPASDRNEDAAARNAGPTRVALLDDVGDLIDTPDAQALLAQMCRDWFRELLRARTAACGQP